MHLKNFSLIHTNSGILFSPAYDLLNVNLIYPQDKEELALTLNARKRRITRVDFDQFATSLGIADKVRDNVYQDFSIRTNQIQDWIDNSFLIDGYKAEYAAIVMKKQNQIGF